jgi:hypothetical protein
VRQSCAARCPAAAAAARADARTGFAATVPVTGVDAESNRLKRAIQRLEIAITQRVTDRRVSNPTTGALFDFMTIYVERVERLSPR